MPPRRQTGGSLLKKMQQIGKDLHNYVKQEKLGSRALTDLEHPKLASHAAMAGYGIRRKVVRRRRPTRVLMR